MSRSAESSIVEYAHALRASCPVLAPSILPSSFRMSPPELSKAQLASLESMVTTDAVCSFCGASDLHTVDVSAVAGSRTLVQLNRRPHSSTWSRQRISPFDLSDESESVKRALLCVDWSCDLFRKLIFPVRTILACHKCRGIYEMRRGVWREFCRLLSSGNESKQSSLDSMLTHMLLVNGADDVQSDMAQVTVNVAYGLNLMIDRVPLWQVVAGVSGGDGSSGNMDPVELDSDAQTQPDEANPPSHHPPKASLTRIVLFSGACYMPPLTVHSEKGGPDVLSPVTLRDYADVITEKSHTELKKRDPSNKKRERRSGATSGKKHVKKRKKR